MGKRKSRQERLQDCEREYRALAAKLAETGYLWNGTVSRQMLTCGKKSCACRKDERRRHGPYAYWTTKVGGKTVSRLLSTEEAALYEEWIENRRRLEELQRELLAISKKVAPLLLAPREEARSGEG